ncbi:MAG: hypothetical protein O3A47_12425 [Chloroflexi bacterium]|nr:hypothetical protein [Chloroflexota bacterium]
MSSKNFMLMIVGVLVLGGAIGGSFVGGMVVGGGDSSDAEAATNVVTLPSPGGRTATAAAEPSGGTPSLADLRQQLQSGDLSQEEIAQLRQQLGAGGAGGGFAGRVGGAGAGLTGTVEAVDGDKITVNTAQGPLEVTIGANTVVQRTEIVVLTLDDLTEGLRITVGGERNDSGVLEATTILVVPEGDAGFGGFGGGGFGGRGGFGGGGQ